MTNNIYYLYFNVIENCRYHTIVNHFKQSLSDNIVGIVTSTEYQKHIYLDHQAQLYFIKNTLSINNKIIIGHYLKTWDEKIK